MAVDGLNRAVRAVSHAWSGSLVTRSVLATLGMALLVVVLVVTAMVNRVTTGLLSDKQERSLTEATADWQQALQLLAAADAGPATASPERIVDGVVSDLAANAGSPARYDVLLLRAPGEVGGPERATNLISPASVPAELSAEVAALGRQMWTNSTAVFLDGSQDAAMAVGAPVEVPGVGDYQLFHVFPYTEQSDIISLVRSAGLVAGLFLALLLGAVMWGVTRHVVGPIREAAAVAGEISEGDLDRRIPVSGSDEVARLGTSFNAMALSLQEQIRELEDLSRVQQRFVSDVSHELRTPLTTVRLASDVLHDRRELVDGDTRRAIELLAAQVDRFEALLADLLEISRIDAGAAEVDVEEVDLADLVAGIVGSSEGLARERSSQIRCRLAEGATVAADRRRLSRIVRNLLTNAIEYGAGDPIDIVVAADEDSAAVGVRDYGLGMTPQQRKRVFDRFWRADPSRARTLGGSGLGLSIAMEDAVLQRGALEVDSRSGAGSLFVLTLPRALAGGLPPSRPVAVTLEGFGAKAGGAGTPSSGVHA